MEARNLPQALTMIMKQRGCSQRQLARQLQTDQSWISTVITGKGGRDFAKVVSMLARVGWEVVIRPKRENPDPVKRREFVTAAASVMFVPSPKVGPYEDPANVREVARRVAGAWHEHGGGAIAPTAMRHIRRIAPAVASRDRQLQEAASELAVATVWTLNDARLFDTGENVGRLALELAKRSESADAQSRAYSALAAIGAERGSADRALMYARDGVMLREVPEAQHAWMRLRKARTLAAVRGQRRSARAEMESVLAALQDTAGFPGQSSFDVANLMGSIGRGLNEVGAHEEAHDTLSATVSLMGGSSPNLQSLNLAEQAISAFGMSEPSLAANYMSALTRLAPLVNSRKLDENLRRVLAESARWKTVSEIRDARDQLKPLIPASAHN